MSTSWVGLNTAVPGVGEGPIRVPVLAMVQLAGAVGPLKSACAGTQKAAALARAAKAIVFMVGFLFWLLS